MNESRFQTVLTLVPVMSAALYLFGFAYHIGYLDGFGVDYSLFDLPPDRALFLGFIAFMQGGWMAMLYGLIALLIFLALALVVISLTATAYENRFICWLRSIFTSLTPGIAVAAGIFLIPLLLFLLAASSNSIGHSRAESAISDFNTNKGNIVKVFTPLMAEPISAMQIECGSAHCAFWLGKESVVLSQNNINRVMAHKSAGN